MMAPQSRIQNFTLFLVLLLSLTTIVSASTGSVEARLKVNKRGGRSNTAFPANLAKRFTSSIANLRERSTKKRSQPVGRGISDASKELKVLLARAQAEFAKTSSSSSAAYTPAATSTSSSSSSSSSSEGGAEPAAAGPSQHAARSLRSPSEQLEFVYDQIAKANWEDLDNTLLCPGQEEACPIYPRMGSYECIDTMSELESCGGCVSKGKGVDCTSIKGAQGVTCSYGQCVVFKCQQGYKLEKDKKTGKDKCKRQTIQFSDDGSTSSS